ncbi:MAG TPA: hypothetical protein VNZ53_49430, partial [Steroidobacteraceae bacterium]|nr:hypothetical protein [Steroidobacteraceae bacterium]
LSADALESIVVHDAGRDADPALMRALQATSAGRDKILKRMRMTAILRPPPEPPLERPRAAIPPSSREEALERCRRVLRGWAGQFSSEELRHLQEICNDATVRDGFLNGMDPEFLNVAFGLGGTMTDAEAEVFVNRFRARTELMQPFSTGPNADDLDVVGALKGLHARIDMGIDQLVIAAAQESASGFVNQRRSKLIDFVLREKQKPSSIYFRWN